MTNSSQDTSKTGPDATTRETGARLVADQLSKAAGQQLERSARALIDGSGIARGSLEAAMTASSAGGRGIQKLAQQVTEQSGRSAESFLDGLHALTEAKTTDAVVTAQQAFFRSCSSYMTSGLYCISDTLAQTAREMIDPWTGSVNAAIEQFRKATLLKTDT